MCHAEGPDMSCGSESDPLDLLCTFTGRENGLYPSLGDAAREAKADSQQTTEQTSPHTAELIGSGDPVERGP